MKPDGFEVGGKVTIGAGARISDGVILAPYGGSIVIGCHAYIGPYAVLYGHGGLVIGDDVMIAAHTVLVPANHGFTSLSQPIRTQHPSQIGIRIMDDVWIGSGVRILDGVTIGRSCIIGAGSVVTKSIPEYAIACGVPAKVIRSRTAITREVIPT
jgi:acetyltransferase-like isoleucine patch superfamily enzyme